MPPPTVANVLRKKPAPSAGVPSSSFSLPSQTKTVAFLHSTPKKETTVRKQPPPRPPPPAPESISGASTDYEMEEDVEDLKIQRKTPAGVRGVPTRYFGPQEKYRRVANSGFDTSKRGNCFLALFWA